MFLSSLHGYRRGRSTVTALLFVNDKWVCAATKGKLSGILLIDLSAAFDFVTPNILTKKFKKMYGLQSDFANWIHTYPAERYQCVWTDHFYSKFF